MKKGVSLISLIIVIIVMIILAGVVIIQGVGTTEVVALNKFAVEILNIQNAVDEYNYRYEKYPTTNEYVLDITTIESEFHSQFELETITDNKIAFKTIDLSLIGINNNELGLGDGTDIYVLSETTGKVYYILGVTYEEKTHYTLTDELRNITEINNNHVLSSSNDIKVQDVIFTPSTTDYTNQPITVQVKLPIDATVTSIIPTDSKSVSEETTQGIYKMYNINETSENKNGNYTIEVNYTYNGTTKKAKYNVTNYDDVSPDLNVTETISGGVTIVNVTTQDTDSGINIVKYVDDEIEDTTYFEIYGRVLNGTELRLNSDCKYTIYVQDKAGNYKILKTEEYAIYSETDSSLTFVRTGQPINIGNQYNGKVATAVYTGFENDTYTEQAQVPWYSNRANIKSIIVGEAIQPISTAYWFYECSNCASLDLTKLNTSKVTSMHYMFGYTGNDANVTSFEITGMNNWDTSQVVDMKYMFREAGKNATAWSIGDLSNWNTGKVTTMYSLLREAGYSANEFDIGNLDNWNVASTTDMRHIFSSAGTNASKWNIGKLDNWNISNVKDISYMFYRAGRDAKEWNIGKLDKWNTSSVKYMQSTFQYAGTNANVFNPGNLANWNTSNVTDMYAMFAQSGGQSDEWSIGDISGWNTSNVTDMYAMFQVAGFCSTYSLDLSGWTVTKVTSYDRFNYGVESKVTPPNFK